LRSLAPQVRSVLARGEERTASFPPPIDLEVQLRGEDLHRALEHDATRVVDAISSVVKHAQVDPEALAAVFLHGDLAETPAVVDEARSRFRFERVIRDVSEVPPALPLPEDASEPFIDRIVKKKPLRVTITDLQYGVAHVPIDRIDGVGFQWRKETTNAVTTNVFRTFIVWCGEDKTQIDLNRSGWSGNAAAKEDDETYQTLVAMAQQLVLPRIRDAMLERLRGGASVKIGSITVSPTGLERQGMFKKVTYLPWHAVIEATFDGASVTVFGAKPGGKRSNFGTVPSIERNAPLLPALVAVGKDVFGPTG
jgi:hypothetical protein